jgi:hypothetical protein
MVVTTEIIKEAARADQKPVTSKALLHLAVSINMAALITKANKPSDNKIAGKVNSLIIEPMIPLITPNKSATQK